MKAASPIPPSKNTVLYELLWLKAHRVPSVLDKLGYRRVFVREINRALAQLELEASRLQEAG